MSPTSQSRQTSYSARHDHRDPTGSSTVTTNNYSSLNTNMAKLGSTTNIASDAALRPPHRISSAYRRTLESYGSSQSGCLDLDTFEVPCPPSAPFPSPKALRFTNSDSPFMAPSATEKDGNSSGAGGRRKSGSGGFSHPITTSTSHPSSSTAGNVPDLGEVDLSDGKNKERPQRFKAVIHFRRKESDSGRTRQGGASSARPQRSSNEENDRDFS